MINKKLFVFDLDGTLAESKSYMDEEMSYLLMKALAFKDVAVISGASYEQFHDQFVTSLSCSNFLLDHLFLFPTCATSFYRFTCHSWDLIYSEDLSYEEKNQIYEAFRKTFDDVGFVPTNLYGKLLEDRGSQFTFSALGQKAPTELKKQWDPDFKKRLVMQKCLASYLPNLEVRVGGSTSIDVTRKGIDKAYGIANIEKYLGFKKEDMLFFGDAIFPGGNDYPVKECGVDCISVSGPEETKDWLRKLL